MMKMEKSIGLGKQLAKRLLPLSLGIGVLIGLGIPAIYYSLEANVLERSAAEYARDLSESLQTMVLETPDLWEYQAYRYQQILQRFVPDKDVTAIWVLDEEGRRIPGFEYRLQGPEDAGWFSKRTASAPILFNNRRVGMVEVQVSQRHLIVVTVSLLVLCSTLGVSVALLVYFFPVRVVTAMEGQIQRLVDDLRRSNDRLNSLLRASQVVASSLSLDRILEGIVHEAAAISGVPQVWLFLLDEDGRTLRCRAAVGFPPGREGDFAVAVGEGLSGEVAKTGQPLAVADVRRDPRGRLPQFVAEHGIVSYLGVPVKLQEQTFGVLVFTTDTSRTYSEEEIGLLSSFAAQAAIAIENARLHEAALRRGEELQALLRTFRSVMAELDLQASLDRIVAEAARITGSLHVKVLLVDRDRGVLRAQAVRGTAMGHGFETPVGVGLSGLVAQTGEAVFSPDTPNDPRNVFPAQDKAAGIVTFLGLPIKVRSEVVGVLGFNTTVPKRYSPEELAYLQSFADQAAIAIENARLYGKSRRHAEELEARVRERTAELEEALRVKTEFLGKMSHELRTPLNHVIGFSDLLKEGMAGPLTPKQATYVDRILTGGKRLLELVTAILDLTEVESGGSRFHLETIPVGSLIQEVVGRFEVQIVQKRLVVTTRLDPELPFVVADHGRLGQALSHLLANAVKFTPDGGRVTVIARRVVWSNGRVVDSSQPIDQLTARPIAKPEEWVEFAVEDTGIGIPPEARERIFEGFYQVDGSEARRYGGTGVGLALVRKLVGLHGGRVEAESAGPGQGARFVIHLPWLEVPSPRRILLVEDDRILADGLVDALGRAGYAVESTGTGGEALQILEGRPPDLLLLDIGLPDMDGWDILRHVRDTDRTRDLPILVLTGLGNTSTEQAMALGASEFLTKPFSISVLVEVAARLLAHRLATGALTGD